MGLKEDVLALAEELDGVSVKENCEACSASGTELCRGDLECVESAHKACAKRLREIVEHDEGEVTTMSAYDLLSEEDRKAIAWVREHGGIAYVKEEWNARSNLDRQLEKAQAKVERQQRHIEFAQGKCHERLKRIAALNKTVAEMRPRLMPEGIEWPKVDGKPVDFVTGYEPSLGVLEAVSIYSNGACEVMGHDGIIKDVKEIHVATPKALDADGVEIRVGDVLYRKSDGRMAKVVEVYEKTFIDADDCFRPGDGYTHRAPVLAADGEPLEVGQTVWHVGNGVEFTVIGLPRSGEYQAVKLRLDDGAVTGLDPDQLTHQRPVLDADGVEIRVGDTVWDVESGIEYEVVGIHTDEDTPVRVMRTDGSHLAKATKPDTLTHQRPVLDADGVPIHEGDTVWDTTRGKKRTVKGFVEDKGEFCVMLHGFDPGYDYMRPTDLTHNKPEPRDSWERIEEDAKLWPGEYAQGHPGWAEHDGRLSEFMALDLVRRCRALAERGE